MAAPDRTAQYLEYLVAKGGHDRYGGDPFWRTPERDERIQEELGVIVGEGFAGTFVMLADVMAFMRREKIPYGPGRGSVGGSYICYLIGIHDVDSLEWDLLFERFMNKDRIAPPDVDIDVSQRDRQRVLQYIVDKYNTGDQVVLQIGAFVRAGGRAVVDLMLAAMQPTDPNAGATATNLKKCFPEGDLTGGVKTQRPLNAWLNEGMGHGEKTEFREMAKQAGWLDHMLKLDGMFTHLGKHAAGVVILRKDDLPRIPKVEVKDTGKDSYSTVTGYDMYSLDDLGYPKWDFLGLRTLDVIADAHKFEGGSGEVHDLMQIWREHRDDPEPYEILQNADTVGIFQMETGGYRRTLREFQPTCFEHIVQLVALYRPGAIDFTIQDGTNRNMVDVFIDRHHGRELATYDHPDLRPILQATHGVILYQEQQMKIAREMGGFTLSQADELRKAIGKKRPKEMARLMALFEKGALERGYEEAVVARVKQNITAAARYSWNKAHAVEYGVLTWLTVWFKWLQVGFYAAEINSWEEKKEKQANVIGEARQHVEFSPPDINVAEDSFIVQDRSIVFGLNGIKGMGDAYRNQILVERSLGGPFTSFAEFCERLPSLPVNMKLALVKCGAFDRIEDRAKLLATVPKKGKTKGARWTAVEHLNHNRTLKTARPLPTDIFEYEFPSDTDLAAGELESMGYYISNVPLAAVSKALARHGGNVIGGEVQKVQIKDDKNGNEYGQIHVITPALTKQRVLIFASNWPQQQPKIEKGRQLLFRGREDGGTFLADACWDPDDFVIHRKWKLTKDGESKTEPFDGSAETVRQAEAAGYRVKLL